MVLRVKPNVLWKSRIDMLEREFCPNGGSLTRLGPRCADTRVQENILLVVGHLSRIASWIHGELREMYFERLDALRRRIVIED